MSEIKMFTKMIPTDFLILEGEEFEARKLAGAISDLDRQRVFNFIVKNDVIYIKNRTTGQTLFEKFISSYQKPFSFTINK
jgi:hypothetical protein